MRWTLLAVAGVVVLIIVLAVALAPKPITKTPAASATTGAPATPATAPSPTPSLTGPVGTSFTVTSGNTSYTVVLTKVLDQAQPDNSFDAANSGDRLVGAEFTITGVKGYSSDDVNSDGVLVGSNNQVYDFTTNGLAVGTNFNSGDWNVSAGQTEVGWEAFQVPDGVSVSSIQWQANSFSNSQPATWTDGS